MMKLQTTAVLPVLSLLVSCNSESKNQKEEGTAPPNIVIIYMDDLGYGDVGAYGATALETPNMDYLANNGVRFTQGYATSATCSPSRFGLLTGMYPWRNKDAKILPGTAPLIIDTAQMTLPSMLKQAGYHTGIVGKWHLGLGDGHIDWNSHIAPGPNELGFVYSHIMAATNDRVPTVYIENGDVVGLDPDDPLEISWSENFEGEPTGKDNPELLTMKSHHGHINSIVNGIPRIGFMKGGESAKWSDVDMADHFLEKARFYIIKHQDEPFFLYYAMHQPHAPRIPHPRFEGESGMGPRGDVIVEADWCIGELIKTLREEGLLENTLIIFTSDNGPVLNDGYYDDAVEKLGDHKPAGPLRGGKYSLFEAGTRVPFVTFWEGTIDPSVSDALICQVDLLSSLAELINSDVRGMDSKPLLPVLMGESEQGREELVIEATTRTAYRKGDYVLIPPYKGPAVNKLVNIELGNSDSFQLYNLAEDPGQRKNLAEERPELLRELLNDFEEVRGKDYSKTEKMELK